jgi:N-acylneuraminate cytidylyltransferase
MENGAFYISRVGAVMQSGNRLSGRIGIYEMPEHTAAELDHPDDWISMEQLMRKYVLSKIKGKKIKLFLTDVDGVMTDAGMYYSENGDEMKKFNSQDGLGMRLLREAGIRTGIITTENTKLVERRAAKLKVDYLSQGRRDGGKLEAAMDICQKEGISLEEVAYIGDDMNCIELLSSVGYAACPANAVTAVKSLPGIIILQKRGGDGAVREFTEWILNLR